MRFRLIFILFNVVLVISFLVIYLMPLVILGWDYTKMFWTNNWFLPIIFVFIIGVLNLYFALNWRLFKLLEHEDWNGLVVYLETQVYKRHRLRKQYIRILANGYLVNSRNEDIGKLASYLKEKKPRYLVYFGLLFGIPHLLQNDPNAMESYFAALLEVRKLPNRNWIEWNHAFSLVMLKRHDEATNELVGVANREKEPVLLLLCIYLLDAFANGNREAERLVTEGKKALKGRFTPATWQRAVESAKDNVEVVILTKLLGEATEWLFSFGATGDAEAVH
ncbi:MAG TPA: hypothetical protein VMW69_02075 [Spirochaetia bacterium]|nr:hypothetical protein [Spirochaetia bacterium]